ncbi:hypothetical protein RS3R6_26180 [Pseudomonas atacamensis]|nr:hypothetical protein RS3R6_26180 [Pseudomonas atacamensis]
MWEKSISPVGFVALVPAPSLASQLPQVSVVYVNVVNDADTVGAGLPAMRPAPVDEDPRLV